MATVVERARRALPAQHARRQRPWGARGALSEAVGVLVSPIVGFFLLQMRVMSAPDLPDPGISTIYIIDPRDVFVRYSQVYASTARLREGARAGFLVPARISYVLFGAVGGFYVFRFVLAVLAAGSAYLLLRRCYGRLAGLAGIIAVLSSPVAITAWGTD